MVILKSLKKQLNQFVAPDIAVIDEETISFVSDKLKPTKSEQHQTNASSAYSHGLESIYALENVDPKTIRKLGTDCGNSEQRGQKKCEAIAKEYSLPQQLQGELMLGEEHCSYMPSFILSLPIHVLELSDAAMKTIQSNGIQFIHDVIDGDWEELIHTKKMGQGHVEELKEAVESYTKGKELYRCQTVDFESLIQGIISADGRVKHYTNLKQYNLEHLVRLNSVMKIEVRRASSDTKTRWVEESQSMLHALDCVEMIRSSVKRVVMTFITPWLRKRQGFAFDYEINDLLEQISEKPITFSDTTRFLSKCYFESKQIFSTCLPCKGGNLFFANQEEITRFEVVENQVLSYFYNPEGKYSLQELTLWVSRELAASWLDYSVDYIEKVITFSSLFTVYKNDRHVQYVSLK